jgi:hypothetical protein
MVLSKSAIFTLKLNWNFASVGSMSSGSDSGCLVGDVGSVFGASL